MSVSCKSDSKSLPVDFFFKDKMQVMETNAFNSLKSSGSLWEMVVYGLVLSCQKVLSASKHHTLPFRDVEARLYSLSSGFFVI